MHTFTKKERLCSKVLIDKLVINGSHLNNFPFKLFWMQTEKSDSSVKIVISVPKRNFKKAVDRNRLKRQIKEAYRKHKFVLYEQLKDKTIVIMMIYVSKEKETYKQIELKTLETLNKLISTINKI